MVLIAMKFMRGSRAGGSKFIDDVLERIPASIRLVTGSPVLRKPFTLQDLDDFMGAFRRPRTVALAECFVFFALAVRFPFRRVHPKIEIWLEAKIVSAEPVRVFWMFREVVEYRRANHVYL